MPKSFHDADQIRAKTMSCAGLPRRSEVGRLILLLADTKAAVMQIVEQTKRGHSPPWACRVVLKYEPHIRFRTYLSERLD